VGVVATVGVVGVGATVGAVGVSAVVGVAGAFGASLQAVNIAAQRRLNKIFFILIAKFKNELID
jgi:hypothetical protein